MTFSLKVKCSIPTLIDPSNMGPLHLIMRYCKPQKIVFIGLTWSIMIWAATRVDKIVGTLRLMKEKLTMVTEITWIWQK